MKLLHVRRRMDLSYVCSGMKQKRDERRSISQAHFCHSSITIGTRKKLSCTCTVSDNCGSQNKCWTLYSALVWIVNDPLLATHNITLKYLEKGHPFMCADGVHGSMNSHAAIYDFKDFTGIIKSSRKDIECLILDHKSMYQFENESKKVKGFLLSEVRVASFRRGSLCLFSKASHDQVDFREVNFLKKSSERELITLLQEQQSPVAMMPCMPSPRGISQTSLLWRSYRQWWCPRPWSGGLNEFGLKPHILPFTLYAHIDFRELKRHLSHIEYVPLMFTLCIWDSQHLHEDWVEIDFICFGFNFTCWFSWQFPN